MKGEFIMRETFRAIASLVAFIPALGWIIIWLVADPKEDKELRDKILTKF